MAIDMKWWRQQIDEQLEKLSGDEGAKIEIRSLLLTLAERTTKRSIELEEQGK